MNNNLNIELNTTNKEVKDMNKPEVKVLKLAYRGFYKLYENNSGQYLVGVNMGQPFVVPIQKLLKRGYDKKWYIPSSSDRAKTRFLLISDGSYDGSSIIDLDSMYIIYTSKHRNTLIYDHGILREQIKLNEEFIFLHFTLVKEKAKKDTIIRIYDIGKIKDRRAYWNHIVRNKDYLTNISELEEVFGDKKVFFEFEEKEKCFIVRRWHRIEYI